jgi:phosphoribosylglycinamide formyltransferase-1
MVRLKVGVLISGRGSNLQALIDACGDPAYPAEIVFVISSRPEAPGLGFAAPAGIPAAVIPHRDRHAFAADAEALLREQRVEFLCLAGFMRVLEPSFVEAWRDQMVNIHPSLLPAFRPAPSGRSLAADVRFAGCTFIRPSSTGPIIGQAVVPVHPTTMRRLSARILESSIGLPACCCRGGAVSVIAEGEIDGCRIHKSLHSTHRRHPACRLPRPVIKLYLHHGS